VFQLSALNAEPPPAQKAQANCPDVANSPWYYSRIGLHLGGYLKPASRGHLKTGQ
jgi:hypothetical protein